VITRQQLDDRLRELRIGMNTLARQLAELTQAIHFHNEAQPEEEMDTRPTQVTDSPWMPAPEQGPPY
jgi:hypothetical protein